MICEAVYKGPGTAGTEQYMLEIILIIFGAFLLGYLFRYFLNDKLKKKNKKLKAEIEELKNAQSDVDAELAEKHKAEIHRLEEKVSRLNRDLSNSISEKMQLKHELKQAEDKLLHQPKAVESESLKNSAPHTPPEELAKNDDLTRIEGIGPKIAELLGGGGIHSFAQLSNSSPQQIKDILITAGPNYAVHNPTTWPEQAKLALNGEWEKLEAMQKELKGGKRK